MKKNICRVIIYLAAAICLLAAATAFTIRVQADEEDVVIIDAADYLQGRTKEEVIEKYTEALSSGGTYINGMTETYYDVPASLVNPYNAGVLSSDTLAAMEGMSNFYRWLIGVNPISVNTSSNSSMQAQALDRNFEFNHFISNSSKPDDMPDEIWNAGYNCTHNILASGYTPSGAITGWLNEGYSLYSEQWGTVGHRTAILNAGYSSIVYGYSGYIAIGAIGSGGNSFNNAFAAFPAAGYMPSNLISRSSSAWTVQLNPSVVTATDTGAVVVKVTNLTSQESYECTPANNYASVSSSFIAFRQPSDGASYYAAFTDPYQVEITGLTDKATGKSAKIIYTVEFFEAADAVNMLSNNALTLIKDEYPYTGSPVIPEYSVKFSGNELTEGVDYVCSLENNVNEGTAVIWVRGIGNYAGVAKKTFTIRRDNKDIADCKVTFSPSYNTYTGEAITPAVTVTDFGETLTEGTDYSVTFSDNIHAGTARALITGKGEYTGETEKTFIINKASNSIGYVWFDTTIETHSVHELEFMAYGDLTYSSSDESVLKAYPDGRIEGVAPGTATLTVSASGDDDHYSNTRRISITVSDDVHTYEVTSLANGEDNVATRTCQVCGHQETFTTMTWFSLWWWTGYNGYSYISTEQNEGASHRVTIRASAPENAEDKTLALESSDESVISVDGTYFYCVGAGEATLTVYAKYNPSVKLTVDFTVSHVLEEISHTEPTCTEDGVTVSRCSICQEEIRDVTPATGHTEETVPGKEATCTEAGLSEGSKCSVCGEILAAQQTIPALGHDPVHHDAKAATCTAAGWNAYDTCSRCDYTTYSEIPALGHSFNDAGVCERCGASRDGWVKTDDGIWHYYIDGEMATGWQKIGGTWYYMDDAGNMQTGWQKIGGTWYYFKSGGQMVTGWQKISGTWYFFKSGGAMVTGWYKDGSTWYFFKSSGAMAANEWCGGYWLNANGSWTYQPKGSWHQSAKGWWFGDTSGWYAKNTTIKIDNKNYTFNASGYWVK